MGPRENQGVDWCHTVKNSYRIRRDATIHTLKLPCGLSEDIVRFIETLSRPRAGRLVRSARGLPLCEILKNKNGRSEAAVLGGFNEHIFSKARITFSSKKGKQGIDFL